MSAQPVHLREATAHPSPGGDRPVVRIDAVLDALRTYWLAHPDLRLGQIVCNLATLDVDPYVVEDTFVLAQLHREIGTRLRYVSRTPQRGARRVHVWREEPSDIEPRYAYTSKALCLGVDRQVFPGELPHTLDPFTVVTEQITCDRCDTLYARLLGGTT